MGINIFLFECRFMHDIQATYTIIINDVNLTTKFVYSERNCNIINIDFNWDTIIKAVPLNYALINNT